MGKRETKTERATNFADRFFGTHHVKATVTDGDTGNSASAHGRNAKEAEQRANRKLDKK